MICVSIGRTRHKMMIMEHRALAARGAELAELRVDWLSHSPDIPRLLKDRPTPVVVTCRRKEDRGQWRGDEELRLRVLKEAIISGAEYVDLEMDVAADVRRYGPTKRIISHHDFEETPDNIAEIHEHLCSLDPDVVKLVTMANSPSDMIRMLKVVAKSKVPTIGFCMGDLGIPSRILCGKYGAPFTYATFSSERELAPGQITFDDMKRIYHYDQIDAETEVYGVIGDPIGHSLSPLIHNAAFADKNINAVYVPFRIPNDFLNETLDDFDWLDVRGISVTIPHKVAVLGKATHKDASVEAIGAANTLYRNKRGTWFSTNTDYGAARESLRLGMAQGGNNDTTFSGKHILVLGAGGVARAVAMGVIKAGSIVMISSRTQDKAKQLAEQLGCKHIQWENRGSAYCDILVNCTPVGMHPNVDDSPFPSHWLRDGMLVFDTIYTPENTMLIKAAKERGCRTVSGVEMFILQAGEQFQCFTQESAPIDVMREALRRGISAVKE